MKNISQIIGSNYQFLCSILKWISASSQQSQGTFALCHFYLLFICSYLLLELQVKSTFCCLHSSSGWNHSFLWNTHFFLIPDQTRHKISITLAMITNYWNGKSSYLGWGGRGKKKEALALLKFSRYSAWYQSLVLLLLVQKCLKMVQPKLKADTARVRNRWEFYNRYKLYKLFYCVNSVARFCHRRETCNCACRHTESLSSVQVQKRFLMQTVSIWQGP